MIISLFLCINFSLIQTHAESITTSGNWNNPAIWTGGIIATSVTQNTTLNSNIGIVNVNADYTIGDVTMNNGNSLGINNGTTLNIGASGNPKNLTTGNNSTINVDGTIIIWGDLIVNNSLILNISGSGQLIVKGNVSLGNGGTIDASGNISIEGNFTGGTSTAINVTGTVSIGGTIDVGGSSTVTGTGTISVSGTCTDGGSTSFCGTGPLPAKIILLQAFSKSNTIHLNWATSSERNIAHFIIQKSKDGKYFEKIASIKPTNMGDIINNYLYIDNHPILYSNYYRILTIDIDGKKEYSQILHIELPSLSTLYIFPNPTSGQNIKIGSTISNNEPLQISVLDQFGKEILTTISLVSNEINFPEQLPNGLYFAKIYTSTQVHIIPFEVTY